MQQDSVVCLLYATDIFYEPFKGVLFLGVLVAEACWRNCRFQFLYCKSVNIHFDLKIFSAKAKITIRTPIAYTHRTVLRLYLYNSK